MDRLPARIVRRVGERVALHAGLRPPEWVLEARLARRVAALGIAQPEVYADLIESQGGARELELLVESLRVGETRFFRHRAQVDAVADVVAPAVARARSGGVVRAWSAGCATGEEAYTLAILLSRGLPPPAYQVSVVGTDISRQSLDVARAREYPASALSHVPGELKRFAFELAGAERFRVVPRIARLVSFEARNLADPDYPRQMDLIWCRNVLIYFTPDARRKVVLRMIDSLAPGGFLFVGYAETLRDFDSLEAVQAPDAVLYRKVDAATARAAAPRERSIPTPVRTPALARPVPPAPAGAEPLPGVEVAEAVVELRGRYEDGERLAREIGHVLSGSNLRVVIDLDGAEYLGDEAGAVLRRACSAARAAGVAVVLVAERQGTRRWLARSGASEEETP